MAKKVATLIVNFGGPRSLEEIGPFLKELLTDPDVIRPRLPSFIHRFLFSEIARKRVKKVSKDYATIGGKSPIFEDTEALAAHVGALAFHRYLPETHAHFLERVQQLDADEICVFPLFPQFSYATTGSIARRFSTHLSDALQKKVSWVSSYATHPSFVQAMKANIAEFLSEKNLKEEEIALLFSAHGLPQAFIDTGDPYQAQCEDSFREISAGFPRALSRLSYQSKFGRAQWITPSTSDVCSAIEEWRGDRKTVVIVPLSFTSDHIETLFEIEELYLPLINERGLSACRCPALNRRQDWLEAIVEIIRSCKRVETDSLIFGACALKTAGHQPRRTL